MGLDMYLTKKTYVGAKFEHREVTGQIDVSVMETKLPIDFKKVRVIEEEAGYWRKANHIHAWFVENVQKGVDNCGEYYVSHKQLEALLKDCKLVKENKSAASGILPTQPGFFFGGTDYDEYYMQDIDDTIKIIEEALKDEAGDYYYQSSW